MINFAWIIPLLPLLAFVLTLFFVRKNHKSLPTISYTLTFASFLLSIGIFVDLFYTGPVIKTWSWFHIGTTQLTIGYEINQLNGLMLLIVTLISLLIQIFSLKYMEGDERITVYFGYVGLFTASMLALVMSPNLLQMYVFWELVGLGSFLLIGFYYYKESAKQAAKKAFIMTRIGDVGLLIGILLLFWHTGTFELAGIFQALDGGQVSTQMITLIGILIFIGAIGKSAQFPLHTWLPDAMEGPTPVSALIHAATMVAAGVYLVAVMYPLYLLSNTSLLVIAVIGGITAFLAATIALVQKDIKKVLAYSTVSQLGFMMLALGTFGYVAAIFHLVTHAFFKALLFLGAGSVIHQTGTQNIEEMGGLRKKMPITNAVFLIGALSISGLPLLSGFFSKEEILLSIFASGQYVLFWVAALTAFLTVCYMFRLYFLVFAGEEAHGEAKESSYHMVIPMVILGVFSIGVGYIHTHWFGTFFGDWLLEGKNFALPEVNSVGWILALAIALTLLGILFAYVQYARSAWNKHWLHDYFPMNYEILKRAYFIDEVYEAIFVKGGRFVGLLANSIDKYIINGLIAVVTGTITTFNKIGSRLQNGYVPNYIFVFVVGLIVLLSISLWSGGLL